MTKDELVAKFDPANANNLSESDLEQMRALTDDEIDHLAKAYPNQAQRKAYLITYDKNLDAKKQLYHLSTWQNLRNVRKFANRKNLIPWTFRSLFMGQGRPQTSTPQGRNTAPARKETIDLSAEAAAKELTEAIGKRPVTSDTAKKVTVPVTAAVKPAAEKKTAAPAKSVKMPAAKKAAEKAAPVNKAEAGKGGDTDFTDGSGGVE